MADKPNSRLNIDDIKVRVLGEKKGRYDLDSLPKLKYKKKGKPRGKKRSKAAGVTCLNSGVDIANVEADDIETQTGSDRSSIGRIGLDGIVEDCQDASAAVTDTLEDVTGTSNVLLQDLTQPMDTSEAVVCQISHHDTYVVEVCRSNALVPVNTSLTAFAIQDYDDLLRQLKSKTFLLIRRSLHYFVDGTLNWVYHCSCNPTRGKLVNSFNISIKEHYNELLVDNPACVHCLATETILDSLERYSGSLPYVVDAEESGPSSLDHDYAGHDRAYNIFELPSADVVCVYASNDCGFVGIDFTGFKCSTCTFNSHSCQHIKFIEEKISQDDVDLPDFVYEMYHINKRGRKIEWKPVCVSERVVQFQPPPYIQQVLSTPFDLHLSLEEDGNLVVVPNSGGHSVCGSCGSDWSAKNPVEESWRNERLLLYTMNKIHPCSTFYIRCSNGDCENTMLLDGEEIGVINMKQYLVAHEVLRDYMYQFLYASCSLYAYFEVWTSRMQDADPTLCDLPTYNQLRYAWYSYLNLLDIDYSDGSCCPKCGSSPDIVVCDATTVAFRRKMVLEESTVNGSSENVFHGSYSSRVMISTKACRTLLSQLISSVQFSTEQMENLREMLLASCPSVIPFLDWLTRTYDDMKDCPRSIKILVKSLAACSSVCGFVHPSESLHSLLNEVVGGLNISHYPSKLKQLQDECPLLFNVLHDIDEPTFPSSWYPVLTDLVEKSSRPFSTAGSPPDSSPDQLLELPQGIAFFPNLPVLRTRGVYAADNCRRKEDICNKQHPSHSLFLPGLFTIFCTHGINYGFEVMQTRESPNVPFTIFRTRFQNAPKIIIYDNACNLHSYCLNRDPRFFKDTKFLVDRFHWKNHRGCSEGYNIGAYHQFTMLNSEVNEQANATLKRLRNQLSYMTQDNFMNHCKFHLWFRNRRAIQHLTS